MSEWTAKASSNIALIKYMGKKNAFLNQASSPSISLTLPYLSTAVRITQISDANIENDSANEDDWSHLVSKVPIEGEEFAGLPLELSDKSKKKFLDHWQKMKTHFGIKGHFLLQSANNFPADCGIASSASSFAALTLAAHEVAKSLATKNQDITLTQLAKLSREGSGSSCRSFFSPWCVWDGDDVAELISPVQNLLHSVVIVATEKKEVSSSEAHKRIESSLLNVDRSARARERFTSCLDLLSAGVENNWRDLYDLCWQEFWDMHALFHTSQPPFKYMQPDSLVVLEKVSQFWRIHQDGPLCTMDAGANVHLIFRDDQVQQWNQLNADLSTQFKIISGKIND